MFLFDLWGGPAMAVATITTKGQVTIPKSVRDSLMLSTGDKIEFVVTDKREALIRPISKKVDEVFGILHKPGRKIVSVEEMDATIRQKMKDNY
jgi:AbrB family looped-hinge helix DNA binding protein